MDKADRVRMITETAALRRAAADREAAAVTTAIYLEDALDITIADEVLADDALAMRSGVHAVLDALSREH